MYSSCRTPFDNSKQDLYTEKGLPSPLLNKIKRLTAFQNPEFYKKQSMRLSTALTPRVSGPVRYKISNKKPSDSELQHILLARHTNFSSSWSDEDKIHDLWPALIADDERNQMICNNIIAVLKEKRSPIVLTERKEHLEILMKKLENFIEDIIVLHGGMKSKLRKEMVAKIAEIPDSKERLLLATGQYIGEGFDAPRLDTLFLAMPFSFKGKMVQYAGRLHRAYEGKTNVRIYDYVDVNIPVLVKMHKKRLKAYKALGYEESTDN
jgi:superfamily II DNA or RNA helicase